MVRGVKRGSGATRDGDDNDDDLLGGGKDDFLFGRDGAHKLWGDADDEARQHEREHDVAPGRDRKRRRGKLVVPNRDDGAPDSRLQQVGDCLHHQRHDQPDLDHGDRHGQDQRAERLTDAVGHHLGMVHRGDHRARTRPRGG